MFCPNCRYEYKEDATHCPDCDVDLVAELTPEDHEEYLEYTEILGTYNPADVAVLKSVLDEEEITYYFHGENFSRLGSMAEPARLMVKADEAEEAREIIADLKLSVVVPTETEGEEEEEEEVGEEA